MTPPGWPGPLVGITDGADASRVRAAVAAGLPTVLLRAAQVPRDLLDLPCRLVLHGRDPEAEALAAERGLGLHLPGHHALAVVRRRFSGPLGQSTHTPAEARAALDAGADWVFLSPIYPPTSKPDDRRPPLGPDALRGLDRVVALGGITPDRVLPCREAGAIGVAVLGGLFGAIDVAATTRAYLQYDQTSSS